MINDDEGEAAAILCVILAIFLAAWLLKVST